jgi:aminoglycoside 3-N-acetyltransferase
MTSLAHTISDQLSRIGLREQGVVLVHASLRSLGQIEGGAETVIQALLAALGPAGTLLLPALSYDNVNRDSPSFDVRRTPACIGALPEYFRQRTGTLRSIHPTHSVCGLGRLAPELLDGHEQDHTPCGPNSPFHRLPDYRGQILFLGCGLRPNTSMHGVEELSEPPYLFSDTIDYQIVRADATVSTMTVRRHGFESWQQRYDRLADVLDSTALRVGKVLAADCHLVEASAMWSAAHARLQQAPFYFVERKSDVDA